MATGSLSVSDLRSAIERREIVPHFQPIVELRTGHLWGFEVLARWLHPQHGLISPSNFLPLAESHGLMDQVSACIFEQAFISMPASFPSHITLSINVTPAEIQDRSTAGKILSLAERTGFPARQLVVEITESALMQNIDATIAVIAELKAHRVRLALDDFGTGYSSLRRLNALSFDELKIDQSFVCSMDERGETRKIAAAVVGLGHSLGLTTVAEGIENKLHADILTYLGCGLGQGWLYGRPVPAQDLPAIISKNVLAAPGGSRELAMEMAVHMEAAPALRLSYLQAIYDGAPVGLAMLDRNFRYISHNRRFGEMSTAQFGPRLGRTIREVAPVIAVQLEPFLKRVLNGEAFSNIEILAEKPEDPSESDPHFVSLQPIRDDTGEVAGISIADADIALQKQLMRMLREDQDHYRLNMERNTTFPYRADPEGKVIWVGTRGITGRKFGEVVKNKWQDVIHPEDIEFVASTRKACLRSGDPYLCEFRLQGADGKWHHVRDRASARRDVNNKIIGWYGLVEDLDAH